MSDKLIDVEIDLSQPIGELDKFTKSLEGLDIGLETVIEIITKLNPNGEALAKTINTLSPLGDKVSYTFKKMSVEAQELVGVSSDAANALQLVNRTVKEINEQPLDTERVSALKDIAARAREAITASAGSNNPVIQTNTFQNQLENITKAATAFKGPLEDAEKLIGATAEQAANAEGPVRALADAIFKATQGAAQTNVVDFADRLKQSVTVPQNLGVTDTAALTASEREVADSAVKAGLSIDEFNTILNQSSDFLAKNKGTIFEVSQAIVAYREQIVELSDAQKDEASSAKQSADAQAATAFAKSQIVGSGDLSGTNAEITKQVAALAQFQREAEKSGLDVQELNRVTQEFAEGLASSDVKVSGLNRALTALQNAARGAGAAQSAAAAEDEKRSLSARELEDQLTRVKVAGEIINQLKLEFPVPAGAKKDEINKYAASLGALQNTIVNTKAPLQDLYAILTAGINGTGEVFTGEANKIQKSLNTVITSFSDVKDSVKNVSQDLLDFLSRVGSQITTILVNQLYHAFTQDVVAAAAFNREITLSLNIAQSAGVSYDQLSKKVIDLSNTYGIARGQVAEGLFQTLKHGVGDVADSEKFLAQAAEFAKVTNSSLVDSVNLGTAAFNSFGLSVDQSAHIFAVLAQSVNTGRLTVQELSSTLGTVGVIGNQVGVTFEETAAALQTLSDSGIKTQQAATFLRNLYGQLVSPTKAFNELLHQNGFESGAAAQATLGLAGVLKLIENTANGNVAVTGELVKNLRGLQAEAGLTGDKFGIFIKDLESATDATKKYGDLTKNTFVSNSQLYDELRERFTNTSKVISDTIIKLGGDIVRALGGAENAYKIFQAVIAGLSVAAAVVAIGSFVATLGTLSAALGVVGLSLGALFTGPTALAALGLGALTIFVAKYLLSVDEAQVAAEKANKAAIDAQKALQDELTGVFKAQSDALTTQANTQVQNIQLVYQQLGTIVSEHLTETSKTLRNTIDLDVKHATEAISDLKKAQQQAQTDSIALDKAIAVEKLKNQDTIFEEQQRNVTLASEIQNREAEAAKLQAQAIADNAAAQQAASEGRIKQAVDLNAVSKKEFDDASKQLDKVAQLRLKQDELAQGYSAALVDVLKKDFELEVKTVNEGEKKILDTFKRIKDATKDVTDKTGDSSGDSTKFLNNQVKLLTTYLNELKGLNNGRVRIDTRNAVEIDPKFRELLDATNPKTIRRLRIAIQSNDKETQDRILGEFTTILKKQDEIRIASAAFDEEQKFRQLANAARAAGNFDQERKYLKDVANFAEKSETEGFRSANNVRSDLQQIQDRLLASFKDEATVTGEKKKRESDVFDLQKQQLGLQQKQASLLQQEVTGQTALKNLFDSQAKAAEEKIKTDEQRLLQAKTVFQELNAINADKHGVVTEDDVKATDKIIAELKNFKNGRFNLINTEQFGDALDAATAKQADLKKKLLIQNTQSDLESARVGADAQGKARLDAEIELQKQIAALQIQSSSDADLIAGQNKIKAAQENLDALKNFTGAGGGDRVGTPNQIRSAEKQVELAKDQLQATQDHQEAIAGTIPAYQQLLEQLKAGKTVTEEQAETFGLDAILVQDLKAKLDKVTETAKQAGIELGKKITLDVDNEQALGALAEIQNSVDQLLTTFKVEISQIQNQKTQKRYHGGQVFGQNGIDAIPAMLTSGEYVVDAKNSSRFYSQLAQISSGKAPSTNNSSVNFGGVNINLNSSGSAKVDAKELHYELERLRARKVIR